MHDKTIYIVIQAKVAVASLPADPLLIDWQDNLNYEIAGNDQVNVVSTEVIGSAYRRPPTPLTVSTSRTLHHIHLINEIEIFPGVFYGECEEGYGRLYDDNGFLGIAQPSSFGEATTFKINLFEAFSPAGEFRRSGYKSQQSANEGLVFHARRLRAAGAAGGTPNH